MPPKVTLVSADSAKLMGRAGDAGADADTVTMGSGAAAPTGGSSMRSVPSGVCAGERRTEKQKGRGS